MKKMDLVEILIVVLIFCSIILGNSVQAEQNMQQEPEKKETHQDKQQEGEEQYQYAIATMTIVNKYSSDAINIVASLLFLYPMSDDVYYIEFELDNGYKDIYKILSKEEYLEYEIGDTIELVEREYDIYSKRFDKYRLVSFDKFDVMHYAKIYDFDFTVYDASKYSWDYISEDEWQKIMRDN